jgi:hypothetical protein
MMARVEAFPHGAGGLGRSFPGASQKARLQQSIIVRQLL